MTNSLFSIENTVAFVTGTNKANGIGSNIVRALVERGASKVYATARNASQLDYLVSEGNGKVVPVSLDVTNYEEIKDLSTKYPDVTLVVNNAGYFSGHGSILDGITSARQEMEINYMAPLAIVHSFAPLLIQANEKRVDEATKPTAIVNINSIASLINFPAGGTYSASKAAVHSLTQAQRRDLRDSLVIGVYPGPIDTDMAEKIDLPKASPRDVALYIVDALENGTEDVFPDVMASQLYDLWRADAKATERSMAPTRVEASQ